MNPTQYYRTLSIWWLREHIMTKDYYEFHNTCKSVFSLLFRAPSTLSTYPVYLTAVAIFRKPNTIPLCFSIDLVLSFLLSWLLALHPSIHVFLGCPLFLLSRGIHSIINLVFSPLASFWHGHTIAVLFSLYYVYDFWPPIYAHYFLYMFVFLSFHSWFSYWPP